MSKQMAILKQINKLYPEAKQKLKELDPDFAVPAGIFEGVPSGHELTELADKPCIKRTFTKTVFASDNQYNGCAVKDILWLHTPGAIAQVLKYFITLGIANVQDSKNAVNDLPKFINAANNLNAVFACELAYNKSEKTGKEYANITVLRKLTKNDQILSEEIPQEPEIAEEPIENVPEIVETSEIESEVVESEPEIIDDFADDVPFHEEDSPVEEIPELDIEEEKPKTVKKGQFDKYQKKLAMFSFVVLDEPAMKNKSADDIIAFIKDQWSKKAFDMSQIDKTEISLLKKVGII